MILVDTSVWIDHFRMGSPTLAGLLEHGEVVTHSFVVGELACGFLRNRGEILSLLRELPAAPEAEHAEVLGFVERYRLHGRGIGWVDAHLLASARLSGSVVWTLDTRLRKVAALLKLGVE